MTANVPEAPITIDRQRIETLRELGQPEGDEFIAELVEVFLRDVDLRLRELAEALESDDLSAASEAAHTLKGCCNNIGAAAMAATALELEMLGRAGSMEGMEELADELERRFSETRPLLLAEAGAC